SIRSGTTWACSRTSGTSWWATAPTTSGCGPRSSGPAPGSSRTSPRWCGRSGDGGRQPILLNVPYANESMFPRRVAEDLHRMRDYHNERLTAHCLENHVPLVDIASKLRDEHFADELHPNDEGAQVIATEVFRVLSEVRTTEGLG